MESYKYIPFDNSEEMIVITNLWSYLTDLMKNQHVFPFVIEWA